LSNIRESGIIKKTKTHKEGQKMERDITKANIRSFLMNLRIFPKNKGFFYIEEALMLYTHSDEPWNLSVMNDIYPIIADKFHTTPAKAERNIRYTVGRIDILNPTDKYISMFGTDKDRIPTNSEFLIAASLELIK